MERERKDYRKKPKISSPNLSEAYLSCEEEPVPTNNYSTLFKNYSFSDVPSDVSYPLANALDVAFFDSNLAVAAYPGCLRFGQVLSLKIDNNIQSSFVKNTLHEIPFVSIKSFAKHIFNLHSYFYNDQSDREVTFIQKTQFTESSICLSNDGKKKCGFKCGIGSNIDSLMFENNKELLNFSKAVHKIIMSTISPSIFQYNCAKVFIKNFIHLDYVHCIELFNLWSTGKESKILWNGVAETVEQLDKEKLTDKQYMYFIFNFFQTNIEIINAMYILEKSIYEQSK